uniref:Uncharacterized protein n=1 Tax=Zea mays TaxID=4577 RepID=B6U524_MAIZE|nr:hypothetical protein [Zea mays]
MAAEPIRTALLFLLLALASSVAAASTAPAPAPAPARAPTATGCRRGDLVVRQRATGRVDAWWRGSLSMRWRCGTRAGARSPACCCAATGSAAWRPWTRAPSAPWSPGFACSAAAGRCRRAGEPCASPTPG